MPSLAPSSASSSGPPTPRAVKRQRTSSPSSAPSVSPIPSIEPSLAPTPLNRQYTDDEDSPDELDPAFFRDSAPSTSRRSYSRPQSETESSNELLEGLESAAGGQLTPNDAQTPHQPSKEVLRANWKPWITLRGHKKGVSAVKFSPDARWIASSCTYTSLRGKLM
jgi:COMPASS component SWD3